MNLWHRHVWKEHARTYAQTSPQAKKISGCTAEEGERLLFGVTTFVFCCIDPTCGAIKVVECLGQEVPQWPEMKNG